MYIKEFPLGKTYLNIFEKIIPKIIGSEQIEIPFTDNSTILCFNSFSFNSENQFKIEICWPKIKQYIQGSEPYISVYNRIHLGYKLCDNYNIHSKLIHLIFETLLKHFNLDLYNGINS